MNVNTSNFQSKFEFNARAVAKLFYKLRSYWSLRTPYTIFLSGASSSNETPRAQALQEQLSDVYLHFSVRLASCFSARILSGFYNKRGGKAK